MNKRRGGRLRKAKSSTEKVTGGLRNFEIAGMQTILSTFPLVQPKQSVLVYAHLIPQAAKLTGAQGFKIPRTACHSGKVVKSVFRSQHMQPTSRKRSDS